ncbi:unnamed protein product [Prunus armeniaca]
METIVILEEKKKYVVQQFTKSEEYNLEMVECFNNVSPNYNWSEIDVTGVWQVLNMGGEGMAHHSLLHATGRPKTWIF